MTELPAIRVRPGTVADLDQVVRIEREAFSDPWPADSLRRELAADRLRRPLVAEADGKVVGYLMAWRVADEWHIINVAVDGRWRRRGVGARLLAVSLDEARATGCSLVTLEVRVGNAAARAFYRRFGFREVGLRRGYYHDTGEDAVLMSRSLAPVGTDPGRGD